MLQHDKAMCECRGGSGHSVASTTAAAEKAVAVVSASQPTSPSSPISPVFTRGTLPLPLIAPASITYSLVSPVFIWGTLSLIPLLMHPLHAPISPVFT